MDLKEILLNASIDALILLGVTAFIFNIFIAIKIYCKNCKKEKIQKKKKII